MTEVLVMGTLPSDISLEKQEYYANPANDFWRLIGSVLNRDVKAMPYDERLAVLKACRIGLWDTYHNCVRPGSMDSDIVEPELNNFTLLKSTALQLRMICFNGKKAGESQDKLRVLGYETRILPSSSGANRKNSAERVRLWRKLILE